MKKHLCSEIDNDGFSKTLVRALPGAVWVGELSSLVVSAVAICSLATNQKPVFFADVALIFYIVRCFVSI